MTSAVITSPVRISERFRDSSNRAAKDSDIHFPNFVGQGACPFNGQREDLIDGCRGLTAVG
jgi:hypothetical protein